MWIYTYLFEIKQMKNVTFPSSLTLTWSCSPYLSCRRLVLHVVDCETTVSQESIDCCQTRSYNLLQNDSTQPSKWTKGTSTLHSHFSDLFSENRETHLQPDVRVSKSNITGTDIEGCTQMKCRTLIDSCVDTTYSLSSNVHGVVSPQHIQSFTQLFMKKLCREGKLVKLRLLSHLHTGSHRLLLMSRNYLWQNWIVKSFSHQYDEVFWFVRYLISWIYHKHRALSMLSTDCPDLQCDVL